MDIVDVDRNSGLPALENGGNKLQKKGEGNIRHAAEKSTFMKTLLKQGMTENGLIVMEQKSFH